MDDLISRQAAIDAIKREKVKVFHELYDEAWNDAINGCKEVIEQLPPIQPIQPKRGRWISADAIFGGVPFYCSECGENTRDTVMGKPRWNFCPNCGAKMRGEQE